MNALVSKSDRHPEEIANEEIAERLYQQEPAMHVDPEVLYDKRWARWCGKSMVWSG